MLTWGMYNITAVNSLYHTGSYKAIPHIQDGELLANTRDKK